MVRLRNREMIFCRNTCLKVNLAVTLINIGHIKRYGNGRSYYDDYLKYYLDDGGSKEEFDKMIEIQKKHFGHCFVEYNVHTDFEGCSYNSLIDHDEEVA